MKLINRYNCLEDEETQIPTVMKMDEEAPKNMFSIGSKNLFKLKRTTRLCKLRRTNISEGFHVDQDSHIDEISIITRKKIRLNCFKTVNRFDLLRDNPEENINKLIKRYDILRANRKSLKKCRQCNFKKRKCSLNPALCTAKKEGNLRKKICKED